MFNVSTYYLAGLTAHRYYLYNSSLAAKAMERLSSGLRINRAADDPAGLCISERMRAQIRGLGQAIRNAEDSISMYQTADGAAASVHDILHRAKELSVQAANGTITDSDRKALDNELQELLKAVKEITHNTEFNGIKLMDQDSKLQAQVGPNSGQSLPLSIECISLSNLGIEGINLLTQDSAETAISAFDKAVDYVSEVRSHYGATMNRLEHTINNLENYQENLTDAESRIRDADMAREMMNFTKYSILAQVAQLMMAQANQQAKGVLTLLKQSLGQE